MDDGFWVFGYGSLMWDPAFRFAEVRRAHVPGYARRFILKDVYGGPGYTNADAEAAIRAAGLKYEVIEHIEPKIAELLAPCGAFRWSGARIPGAVAWCPSVAPAASMYATWRTPWA